jgi:hypothetical protein
MRRVSEWLGGEGETENGLKIGHSACSTKRLETMNTQDRSSYSDLFLNDFTWLGHIKNTLLWISSIHHCPTLTSSLTLASRDTILAPIMIIQLFTLMLDSRCPEADQRQSESMCKWCLTDSTEF